MDLATIKMKEPEARKAFEDYRQAVREPRHKEALETRRELERLDRAVMRGYKMLAKGHQLLELSKVVAAGGTTSVEMEYDQWRKGGYVRESATVDFPRLAVCRADARFCFTRGIARDGSLTFYADERGSQRKADRLALGADTFERKEGARPNYMRALVPTIPPPLRPPHQLRGYHILWEAEWSNATPVDPALLKHLGGDLYAVLAVWDLSPLERAVLGGRATE